MNPTIFNSILNGSLQPKNAQTKIPYSEIAHLLSKNPQTLPEIDQVLAAVLGQLQIVLKNDVQLKNTNDYYTNVDYTPIVLNSIEPEIEFAFPMQDSSFLRFYHFVITTEARRIKLRSLEAVEILKDDICSIEEIKDTLHQLARYAKQIPEYKILIAGTDKNINTIFDILLTQIVKLYFEMTLIFESILKEKEYHSFIDFHSICLNQVPSVESLKAFNKATLIHKAQNQICSVFDKSKTNQLLENLYHSLLQFPSDSKLIAVTVAIENYVFLQQENSTAFNFVQLANSEFSKEKYKEKRQAFSAVLSKITNPREAFTRIEEYIDTLPVLPTIPKEVSRLLDSSIIRQLSKWLSKQQEICENNFAQTFSPTVKNSTNTNNTKPKREQADPQEKQNTARKLLNFLSGYNSKNEKIMSDNDFARLVEYTNAMIQTDVIPENIKPIASTNITNEYLRYTFYMIHKQLYTTRPIRIEWIELLHLVFNQFNGVEIETTRKKFSTKPVHYDKDIIDIQKKIQ